MTKTIQLTCILTILWAGQLMAQSTNEYPHCNCVEKINEQYQLICNNSQIVTGQYANGLKSGKWTTKTAKGTVIKNVEYIDGRLNGKYELFHFDGKPKLVASFVNGQQDGTWEYFNEKGKIIKTGKYQSGSPVGTWTIFDKGGKKAIAIYDFDNKNSSNSNVPPYFKNGGIERDDQSGEWYIIYYPERNPQSEVQPFGGYSLACDFFLKHLTIPTTMMDTYTNFNFNVTLKVENNSLKSISSAYVDRIAYNTKLPTLPFIVSTNPPAKLKRIEHDKQSIDFLRENIEEVTMLMGPWIGNSSVDIYVPFVLNDIKRF
jgi:antitoxin component YwqK of YwqJK toxin-antitoxin module